jgi:hypothetical protein
MLGLVSFLIRIVPVLLQRRSVKKNMANARQTALLIVSTAISILLLKTGCELLKLSKLDD